LLFIALALCLLSVHAQTNSNVGRTYMNTNTSLIPVTDGSSAVSDVTKTVGGTSPDYATLKLAFDAINSGAITGAITLQITGSTTENPAAVLYQSGYNGTSNYTSVVIYPTTSGLSVSGSISTPLIDLNGADNVTIDGRVGQTGSTIDLVITNTSTSNTAATSTIRFINDATNNTVRYCTVKGSETSTGSGIIFFSTTTGTTGNDLNSIDHNNLTCSADANRPLYAIYSSGSSAKDNSGNTITNNVVYDYLNRGTSSAAIYFASNTLSCTISGNSFYESSSFVPTAGGTYYGIRIDNTSMVDFTVSDNYIGGSSALCAGTWTKTAAYDNTFYGIYLNIGTTTTSSIQNNTIRNFSWSNSGAATWSGVYVAAGAVNIGTVTGNTIGSTTGTGSITLTAGATGANLYAIHIAGSGNVDCQKNSIGSMTGLNVDQNATNVYGIFKANVGGNITISNNNVGSTSTANSMMAYSASTSNAQIVAGIYSSGSGTVVISSNLIANLTNATTNTTTGTSGLINGIASNSGTNTISNNTVHDLTIANANTSASNTASVIGIALNGSTQKSVTGNTIYNLSNTYTSFAGSIIGLYYTGNTGINSVSRNFIHSLQVDGASSGASIYAIKISSGLTTFSNNILLLSGNTASTLFGIYETGTSANNNYLYFNTIYLSGNPTSGSYNSYALYSAVSTNTRNFRNNILYNSRSNSGASGKHYAVWFNYAVSTNLTLDYNLYRATGTGGVLGYYNSADVTSVPLISGQDTYSLTIDPGFTSPGSITASDYQVSSPLLAGIKINSISTDYQLTSRAGTPTIGAYEGSLTFSLEVYTSGVLQTRYTRLKDVFDNINNGTHQGLIEIKIIGNTTEKNSAVIYQSGYNSGSGSSNYSSVLIYPTSTGLTIAGNLALPLIDFNGADQVVIDGRVNATGSSPSLTIVNQSTSTTSNTSTVRFINSATGNTIQYCTLQGTPTGSYCGIILFSQSNSGSGNDDNTIDHCNVSGVNTTDRPVFGVYSYGTSGMENNNITITNSNFYDLWRSDMSTYSINLTLYTADCNISGNSFYETAPLNPTTGARYYAIKVINLSANNFIISNNFIGGRAPSCGGSKLTINGGSVSTGFFGIHVDVNTLTPYSAISGNIIKNIDITSANTNPFFGIDANRGSANVTGNTIGENTGTGSVQVTITTAASTSYGIYVSDQNVGSTLDISDNNIGSITTVGTVNYGHHFNGIYINSANPTVTITNNLIGSLTTSRSIQTSSAASSGFQHLYGIQVYGTGTTLISGNTVSNLHNAYSGSNTITRTIGIITRNGVNSILNNTVRNISTESKQTTSGSSGSIFGIFQSSQTGQQIVSGNIIHNISNIQTSSTKLYVCGLYYQGPTTGTNYVTRNFIDSVYLKSADYTSMIEGIILFSGSTVCANNIISLGTAVTNGYAINGITETGSATTTAKLYFNTVYLGGTISSGTTQNSYALYNYSNLSVRDYRNNILVNARSGGTTGKHYAVRVAGTAYLTCDYNDYYAPSGVLGLFVSTDKTTLSTWQAATLGDTHSILSDPVFAMGGGSSAMNYATSASLVSGVTGTGITNDYNGLIRGNAPHLGALETLDYTWTGAVSNDFATAANWESGEVPLDGGNIIFATSPSHDCVLDQNRIVGNITNHQGTYKFLLNGKNLTLNGSFSFTNGAQIDATTNSSGMKFAGTSSQNIPASLFFSNLIPNLTLDNPEGLTIGDDLTVSEALVLSSGTLFIGAHTLTVNGSIVKTNGNLEGGGSSNLVIGGNGSATTLPAITLNNLTINRLNGISLGGSLNIGGTLNLTNGTLALGANTLTFSGSSILRTSGYLDAGNAASTLVLNNGSAVTLPASMFSGTIQNLTVGGAGGVTSLGNLSVNGILALSATNPSATKGIFDMETNTLTMGPNATTTGSGDVTGIVTRTSFSANTPYSFGNQYTRMTFAPGGTFPSLVSFKITLGASPTWKSSAITRVYDIVRTGGSSTTVTVSLHYLDEELNGNTESSLVFWDRHSGPPVVIEEHGKSNQNFYENWVSISNRNITYFATSFDDHLWTLSNKESQSNAWQGSISYDWNEPGNWSVTVPVSTDDVIIPDATTTLYDPVLPSATTINSLTIESGGILEGGTSTVLTLAGASGAWLNMGTFNAGTSTVTFTNAKATMADPTNFYNVTIASGAVLTPETDNVMRISGTLTNDGTLNAALLPNIIEFNGSNQTLINPNGATAGYYHLILSGGGTKTLPASALNIVGDFSSLGVTGAATTVNAASALTVGGNFTIGASSTFVNGNFNHSIAGNFINSGTYTSASGYGITFNGTTEQTITGNATTFDKLSINNSQGVSLFVTATLNNTLTLTNGTLNIGETTPVINGSIDKIAGQVGVNSLSSLTFGGTAALILPNDLFSTTPSINNLTVNRSGGVTLGNQNMTVNGTMSLASGIFNVGANILTLSGSSPTRSSGSVDLSNGSATLLFTNTSAITLPASIFTSTVNNLTINSSGGVTAGSDFTINGTLYLQSENPSAIKGTLAMGSNILTMGSSAVTSGTGDVTGIVRRTSFVASTAYSFGNKYTTITFLEGGTYPTEIKVKISIGAAPSWKSTAVQRVYDFIQSGGSNCNATIATHYLDSELQSNNESELVQWTNGTPGPPSGLYEWGKSNNSNTENWVAISNVSISSFPTAFDQLSNGLSKTEASLYTWTGATSSNWSTTSNWSPNGTPASTWAIIIPDAQFTANDPTLASTVEVQTIALNYGSILNAGTNSQLTINGANGAWNNNGGTFVPSNSNVIFTNTAATMAGTTSFYDLTINSGAIQYLTEGAHVKIGGTMTNHGTWRTVIGGETTVEYNGGDQAVVVPNTATHRYYNLVLSGTGSKTMPSSAMDIVGDLTLSGTATLSVGSSLAIAGSLTVGSSNSFTVGPQASVTVSGTLSNSAGNNGLLVQSDATGTGSLIASESVPATVERYIPNNSAWHFLSSPVASQPVWPGFSPTPTGSPLSFGSGPYLWDFFYWNPNANITNELYWVNLRKNEAGEYNERTVDAVGSNAGFGSPVPNFTVGRGYLTTYSADWSPATGSPETHLFTGNLNAGNQTAALTYGANPYNLAGNPYPSAIDWKAATGWIRTGLASSGGGYDYWIFNDAVGNYGVYNSAETDDEGTNGTSRYIAPMQAYFVQAASTATMSMTRSIQVHASQQWLKESMAAANILRLKLTTDANSFSDELVVKVNTALINSGSLKFWSMYTEAPEIYTVMEGSNYSVRRLSNIDEQTQLSVGIKAGISSNYTLSAGGIPLFSLAKNIWLDDLKTGVVQDLKSNPNYRFNASPGDEQIRFRIRFGGINGLANNEKANGIYAFSKGNRIIIRNCTPSPMSGRAMVFNLLGQKIHEQKTNGTEITLDQYFPIGIYLMVMTDTSSTVSQKIVVKSE